MAVRADVEGAVLAIVTCARAPKAFSESGSGAMRNGNIEEARWGRNDRTIVSELYDKGPVDVHSVFIQAVFGVNGSEGRRGVDGAGEDSRASRDAVGELGAGTGIGDGD